MKIRKRYTKEEIEGLYLVDIKELCARTSLGRDTAIELAKRCGARVKIGKCARYDVRIIQQAINEMRMQQNETM